MKPKNIYIKPYNSPVFPFAAHWYNGKTHYFDVFESKLALIYAMTNRFNSCRFYDWSDSK